MRLYGKDYKSFLDDGDTGASNTDSSQSIADNYSNISQLDYDKEDIATIGHVQPQSFPLNLPMPTLE